MSKFKVGDRVYAVYIDEDGGLDYAGYTFVAEVCDCAIVAPAQINGKEDIKYIIDYERQNTESDIETDLKVYPMSNCYASVKEVNKRLDEFEVK